MNKKNLLQNQKDNTTITYEENFIVVLDSRSATQYKNNSMNSSLMFQFEEAIRSSKNSIDMSLSILNFTCPISFYQINSSNNTLFLLFSSTSIIFPNGNYNCLTFIQIFNQLCINYNLTLTIDYTTNKFTIKGKSLFTILQSNIYNVMGFQKGMSYSSDYQFNLVLPYCCNFAGINSFNIKISNINTKNLNSYDNCQSSIFATVPITNQQGNLIYYNKLFDYDFSIGNNSIDYFQIDIQDDQNNYIDFNNQNWNMTLLFRSLKK